tara:strand:+ start:1063 stop:1545 length:483 start_codon:yes stop_codon:yes gene_type:complete
MNQDLLDLKKIKLFVYDFDGVMTNNTFSLDEKGNEQVFLNRSDGLAVNEIRKRGFKQLILSTEKSKIIILRAKKLKIESEIGVKDKLLTLKAYLSSKSLKFNEIAYVGNDINDFEAMSHAKLKICPRDAQKPIKKISDIILKEEGGKGVIREILSLIIEE